MFTDLVHFQDLTLSVRVNKYKHLILESNNILTEILLVLYSLRDNCVFSLLFIILFYLKFHNPDIYKSLVVYFLRHVVYM